MSAVLAGRLSDPEMTFETDPRSDPRIVSMLQMMAAFLQEVPAPASDASYAELVAYCNAVEEAGRVGHDLLWSQMDAYDDIESHTEVITGVDGNEIQLYVHRPKNQSGPLPCFYHTHGGGMVILTAADPAFVRLRNDIARGGAVVVGVEFRNGGGRLGAHPFPAGLNDCASGLRWVNEHKDELGVDKVVICGESGGGNLAIATTLKAKQEGWVDHVNGVYAMCPYISGEYAQPPAQLGSLKENDGYMLDCGSMACMVRVYDPELAHASNPLAWPLQASPEQLNGLPPHVISVNELDPLRDEGLAFYRKLLAANVSAMARTAHGTPHAGDQIFNVVVPEAYSDLLASMRSFAARL